MKILHYSLGFPPYRSGGLTKFCIDLMAYQVKEGHNVGMLWPGRIQIFNKKTKVWDCGEVYQKGQKIQSFEIINPLPVPFDEGIADFSAFTIKGEKSGYIEFLKKFKPDVIHIHTLMGIHKSFFEVAKEQNIRMVFSTHDFYPICPKVTLFRKGEVCNSIQTCLECGACNSTALSLKKIQILQSPLYRKLKDSFMVKKLRKKHRNTYLSESKVKKETEEEAVGTDDDYKKIRRYYYSILKLMDVIHYNSNITKMVYEKVFNLPNNKVLNITHMDVEDNKRKKQFTNDKIQIRYLGAPSGAKGFFILKEALDQLWKENQKFYLHIHFEPEDISPYMIVHDRYNYKDLETIFDDTDILIAPSIWYETFGFTVLEALSYGVPVIISGTVGAKDILAKGAGIVIENITSEKILDVIQNLTMQNLKDMNNEILKNQKIMQIEDMSKQIEENYYN